MTNEQKEQLKKVLERLRNNINNDEIDDNINIFEGTLDEISEFMKKPFLEIIVSRSDSSIKIHNATIGEIKHAIPGIIAQLLDLVPQEDRNDMLINAISSTTNKKGKLYEDENE